MASDRLPPPSDDRPSDLAALKVRIWDELRHAVDDRNHPWRTPVLATRDGDGADARTVVLRDANEAARSLVFYADARSGKVAQIAQYPVATLVCWSNALNWQLRLRCKLEVSTDGLAVSSRWAKLQNSRSAQDYLSPLAPGTALKHPARPATGERSHFAMVYAEVRSIDWLELNTDDGHNRAVFDKTGARWLVP
jgi:pyridoxamine 5'-phosphate oxidase